MAMAIRKTRTSVARTHAAKQARPGIVSMVHETFGTLGAIAICAVLFIALVVMFGPDSAAGSTAQAAAPEAKTEVRFDRAQHLLELEAQYLEQ